MVVVWGLKLAQARRQGHQWRDYCNTQSKENRKESRD